MGELDHGAKLALRIDPTPIICLGLPSARDVRPFPAEVVSAQRTADGAFLAVVDGEEVSVHVEFEAEPTSDVGDRVARAACALFVVHGRPVRPVVYYLHESADGRRPKDRATLPIGDWPPTIQFPRVPLWEIDPEVALTSRHTGLLAFVGLMRGATLEHVRRAMRALDSASLDAIARADLEAALYFLSSCKFDRGSLGGIIRMEALMTSPGFQWAVQLGVRKALVCMLEARMGAIPDDLKRAIDETEDASRLDEAIKAAAHVEDPSDLPKTLLALLRVPA